MNRSEGGSVLLGLGVAFAGGCTLFGFGAPDADVIIYGGSSAGVAAAVQVARMGRSVVLIEPSRHLGGLSSGGLGMTDSGDKRTIGGVSREFYRRLKRHYDQDSAWRQQARDTFPHFQRDDDAAWRFEPHVAEKIFGEMLAEAGVRVVLGERLHLAPSIGVRISKGEITSILMESGKVFTGRVFLDTTYEGDLMAKAGITYTIGRESNALYGETLNGVQTRRATKHQFERPIDPYVVPGDPTSGLLPGVQSEPAGDEDQADHRVQAYCFRMCTTDAPENRVPFPKPENYDAGRYELCLRFLMAGGRRVLWHPSAMPNRKTDTNNNGPFSTDNIGMNYDYPDGDYATREKIVAEHEAYQKGLIWFLANDPRVPEEFRSQFRGWGLAKDEFTDNGNWPHQLYIREARRMVSDYVVTELDCRRQRITPDPVGLGSYNMDSHNVQRYVDAGGHVRNEGDIQVSPGGPYAISYRALRPLRAQCTNLLVPVCLSASHAAYGSIRMEPVFMILGQSAATAAVLAIEEDLAVQDVNYSTLSARLLADGQVLEAPLDSIRPVATSLDPKNFSGVIVDDRQAKRTGNWFPSTSAGPFVGEGYQHDGNSGNGQSSASFEVMLPGPGRYEVLVAFSAHQNRAPNVPVEVRHQHGADSVTIDQRHHLGKPPFAPIGTFSFGTKPAIVVITNAATTGYVIIDAVQFVRQD